MPIEDILAAKLKKDETTPNSEWRVWEHKTLNLHRAVLEWTPANRPTRYAEITAGIRSEVARRFRVSWWRGMGFGAVIYLDAAPADIASCVEDIDGRQNPRGTWQWSIVVFKPLLVAAGVHMWISGYLSDVYERILGRLESDGFRITSCKKDKDMLMKFLTMFRPLPEHVDPRRNAEL
jgi:hypothetical protein